MEEQIIEWIYRINKSERVHENIAAFNFGLFPTQAGYTIYLMGSESFDANDDDWAACTDFEPKEKYLPLHPASISDKTWEDILQTSQETVTNYVLSDSYRNSILKDAEAITVGFDGGDLIRIK